MPSITNAGADGPEIAGTIGKIGQVYLAADQHYVLLNNGLAPVGPVMLDLLLASDPTVTPISAAAAAAARSGSTFEPAGFPTSVPELAFASQEPGMLCLVAGPGDPGTVSVVLHERRPPLDARRRPRPAPDRTGRSWPTQPTPQGRTGGDRPAASRRPTTPLPTRPPTW